MTFKVWDKVRCIDNSDSVNITLWKEYLIDSVWYDMICITHDNWANDQAYYKWRFELVEQEPSQPQKLSKEALTYQTQILRSDWLLFTPDMIGEEKLEDIKQRCNKDKLLLREHKKLFKSD